MQHREANNAVRRTADPRIYAATVRQSVTQQEYTMDEAKFAQCIKPQDVRWNDIDATIGGVACGDSAAGGGANAAAAAAAWFPIAPGKPEIDPGLDAVYEKLLFEPGRKRARHS